jgi:hypothetical protein
MPNMKDFVQQIPDLAKCYDPRREVDEEFTTQCWKTLAEKAQCCRRREANVAVAAGVGGAGLQ